MRKKLRVNEKGFTLAELLIVVAIIAVLVAISIPIFNRQLEKSREATDLANARSCYAQVVARVTSGEEFDEQTIEETFSLKQKRANWQTEGEVNVGGVSQYDEEHWHGEPDAGGSCTVLYNEANGIEFYWGESAGKDSGIKWNKADFSNLNIKTIPAGYFTNSNLSEATPEQKELVEKVKKHLGYDEATVTFANHGSYRGTFLVSISQGTYESNQSSQIVTATRIFVDKNTGEIVSVWEQAGSWGINSGSSSVGFWGSSGKQTVTYECKDIEKYH